MRKKLIALILCGAIAGSFMVPLAACVKPASPSGWDKNVTVTANGAEVNWKAVKGAKEYKIYHSPSRFGTYELVSTQTELSYANPDKYGYYRVDALDKGEKVISSELYSYEIDTFGNNTHIYAPTDDEELVQADIDRFRYNTSQFADKEIYEPVYEYDEYGDVVTDENGRPIKVDEKLIGEGRFAALFKAGEYDNLDLVMRYYMTFSGLGYLPTDTELGAFNTYGELSGGNATCNFWCGIDNLTVNDDVQWAVSQATSFRRMQVNGNLTLHDTGATPWASGGFISDTVVTGTIDGTVQQQWFTRNSDWAKWTGCDLNMVYAGCKGTIQNTNYTNYNRVTYLDTTRVMREKPYLVFDGDEGYSVCRPALQKNSKGITWNNGGNANDEYIPLDKFYVARSDRDNAASVNAALKNGKNVLFTPGIYDIESPILVENPDTVIMGIGLASLKLTDGNTDTIMRISDVDGVQLSGIMFDAGTYSKTLLQIGTEKTSVRHNENPTVLNDVYYRIGGAGSAATSVDTTLEINSNDVVGDNFWVWRADHGNKGTVGWYVNKTKNGVIVNGDYVTVYGLMVEHFHQYQTIWNGEYGFMAFYQSETPYDVENEKEEWTSEWNGKSYEGYASYKVADNVINHEAHGLGVYYVARNNRTFTLDHTVEIPSNAGIFVEHMAIANFSHFGDKKTYGGIRYIVNDRGTGSFDGSKHSVASFIAGEYKI